ncbi:hypothetical protein WR25_26769 [Diploscapter pachys]|uniref:Peptidase metallopeptidase domain-containing protein n=1 Tax=Diploscapter pachys TaxID=2018661 RepID=A0A2A2LIZ5_9BILA|nr:hypothetical protein WR25_26769 [Diploscapter pachys]
MRQILRYSTVFKLLLLFLIANVSADERLKRQAGTTIRKWALNTVYYYFDASLTTAQQTLANRVMKSIIQPSTCISVVVNATARNRGKIVSDPTIDFGESSDVGGKSKEQTITMGSKCIYDGAFAKAIFHVLGFYTMERRSDRDNFVNINSNSVNKPAGYSYVQFQYVSFSSTQTTFSPGCRDFGLEVKYQSNQQLANPRVCSDAWNGLYVSSPLATTPIVAYTGTISATNVYKHVHIDAYNYYYNRSLFRKFSSISSMW